MHEIACFVSPHGFGHATRSIAVVEALQRIQPDIHALFFTTVPRSLFEQTLTNFSYHPVLVDVGLVQSSALDADIPATIRRLDDLLPYDERLLEDLATLCANCSLILCDIAPLGIAVAQYASIPSILVENFTWEWIYQPYLKKYPNLQPHAEYLNKQFELAKYHIQTEPLCFPAPRDLLCGPIFRQIQGSQATLRKQLNCGDKALVIITMGGFFQQLPAYQNMTAFPNIHFVFTGQKETALHGENFTLLSRDNTIYHPDLLSVADLVVCKAGYSTVAECCQTGARVISVGRADFPEAKILQSYVEDRLGGISISSDRYQNGSWLELAADLLSRPKPVAATTNGADQVADFLCKLISKG